MLALAWSAKRSVQTGPSQALTFEKSSVQTNCASVSPIGKRSASGVRYLRAFCKTERRLFAFRRGNDPVEGVIALQQTIQRLQFGKTFRRQRMPLVLTHKAPEPLAQASCLIRDLVELAGECLRPNVLERLRGHKLSSDHAFGYCRRKTIGKSISGFRTIEGQDCYPISYFGERLARS